MSRDYFPGPTAAAAVWQSSLPRMQTQPDRDRQLTLGFFEAA